MKIFLLLLIATLVSFANEVTSSQFANIKIGANLDGTAVIGADLMTPAKTAKQISMGIGFDFIGYEGAKKATQTYGSAYSMGAGVKVGYNLEPLIVLPLHLKAGVGYGVAHYDTINDWGLQYDASMEMNVYKKLGVGVSYKVVQTDTLNEDKKSTLVYMTYDF
ncbi:MAG: hypothetical protein RBR59_09215 [Sulfurimonadaceae bacterium]|jgi:hypothetical protein|nr:hypothetical protein [Sulfurimonadaceae bacterium]